MKIINKLLLFFLFISIFKLFSDDPKQLAKNWYDIYVKNLSDEKKVTLLNYINAMINVANNPKNSNQFKLNKKNMELTNFNPAIGSVLRSVEWLQGPPYTKAIEILPVFKNQLEQSLRENK